MSNQKNLNIIEIFPSIQGESTYQGEPCTFIRLSGCNLKCKYCDTLYSHEKGVEISQDTIIKKVKEYKNKLVEITGGEPLLQKNSIELMEKLIDLGYTVLLETNGSISIKNVPKDVISIVDIKSPASGMNDKMSKENIEIIRPHDQIKFVLMDRKDYLWAKEFVQKFNLTSRCKILFSAVFESLPLNELADWIVEDKLNVRLNVQIHKFIWGIDSRK